MNRRELLAGAGAVAGTFTAGMALASEFSPFEDHHHAGPGDHSHTANTLVDFSLHCIATGRACIAHCMMALDNGDKSMSACNKAVHNMVEVCTTLVSLASYGTNPVLLKEYAAVCAKYCTACAKACRAHTTHKSCLDCMKSCEACAQACLAFAA